MGDEAKTRFRGKAVRTEGQARMAFEFEIGEGPQPGVNYRVDGQFVDSEGRTMVRFTPTDDPLVAEAFEKFTAKADIAGEEVGREMRKASLLVGPPPPGNRAQRRRAEHLRKRFGGDNGG